MKERKDYSNLGVPMLNNEQSALKSHLTKAQSVEKTIGTPDFTIHYSTHPEKTSKFFDVLDTTDPNFIDNIIRAGLVKECLSKNAIPYLEAEVNRVKAEIENKERLNQRLQLESQIATLEDLQRKGYLPEAGFKALEIARLRLSEIVGPSKIDMPLEPKPSETEPIVDYPIGKKPYEGVEEDVSFQPESTASPRDALLKVLREGKFSAPQLAEIVYGENSKANRHRIHVMLSFLNNGYLPEGETIRSERQEGTRFHLYSLTGLRETQDTRSETLQRADPKSYKEKKESPLSRPISPAHAQAIIDIISGRNPEEVIPLLGNNKKGQPYNRSTARWALQNAVNFLSVRRGRKKTTGKEEELWQIIKTATGKSDDSEARVNFNNTLHTFFHGRKEEGASGKETRQLSKDEETKNTKEGNMPVEKLTSRESAAIATLIRQHAKLTIIYGQNELEFEVPEKVLERSRKVVEEYIKGGKYENGNSPSLEEVRTTALDRIIKAFKDDSVALEFIEGHGGHIRDILYWLNDEREYIFELLLHDVQMTNKVDVKRSQLLDIAFNITGLKNGPLEALRARILNLNAKQVSAGEALFKEVHDEEPESTSQPEVIWEGEEDLAFRAAEVVTVLRPDEEARIEAKSLNAIASNLETATEKQLKIEARVKDIREKVSEAVIFFQERGNMVDFSIGSLQRQFGIGKKAIDNFLEKYHNLKSSAGRIELSLTPEHAIAAYILKTTAIRNVVDTRMYPELVQLIAEELEKYNQTPGQ